MFASIELAARVDRSEASLMVEAVQAIAEDRPEDTFVHEFAGGAATIGGPGSPMNKLIGVGFEGQIQASDWELVEAEHVRRGLPVQVELSTLADQSIAPALTGRGYRLVGFENVHACDLSHLPHEPTRSPSIRIERSGYDAFEEFIDVIVEGFAHPDTQGVPPHESEVYPREVLEGSIRDIMLASGFRRYVARIDGELAGAASMRIANGVALLCGAATLPRFRRRGVQTALTRHRLHAAEVAECDLAVVVTQPGSKSAENATRLGFELLYPRAALVLDPGD